MSLNKAVASNDRSFTSTHSRIVGDDSSVPTLELQGEGTSDLRLSYDVSTYTDVYVDEYGDVQQRPPKRLKLQPRDGDVSDTFTVCSTSGATVFRVGTDAPDVGVGGDVEVTGGVTAVGVVNGQTDVQVNGVSVSVSGHSHVIGDVTGLQTALDGKSSTSHDHDADYAALSHAHIIGDVTGLQTALDGKSSTSHDHDADYVDVAGDTMTGTLTLSDVNEYLYINNTSSGSYGIRFQRSAVNKWALWSSVSNGFNVYNYSLSRNDMTISASGDTNFAGALSQGGTAVSVVGHSHIIGDVTGLQTALDGKSSTSHNHDADYAALSHAHIIGDVTGLQTALDGKSSTSHDHDADYAALSHAHIIGDVTGLQTALDGKEDSHTHPYITDNADDEMAGMLTLTKTAQQLQIKYNASNKTDISTNGIGNLIVVPSGGNSAFTGTVSATLGLSVGGTSVSLNTHDHDGSYAALSHSHVTGDVTGLDAALAGKSSTSHDHDADYAALSHAHIIGDVTGLQTALDGKSSTSHDHDADYVEVGGDTMTGQLIVNDAVNPQLRIEYNGSNYCEVNCSGSGVVTLTPTGAGAAVNVASTLKQNGTQVSVVGHSHTPSDIGTTASVAELDRLVGVSSDIQAQLSNKLALTGGTVTGSTEFSGGLFVGGIAVDVDGHSHVTGDVTGLDTALAGKSSTSHDHDADYAALSHAHIIGDVTGLQAALDGKSSTSHDHDADYVGVGGDTMTGTLTLSYSNEYLYLNNTNTGSSGIRFQRSAANKWAVYVDTANDLNFYNYALSRNDLQIFTNGDAEFAGDVEVAGNVTGTSATFDSNLTVQGDTILECDATNGVTVEFDSSNSSNYVNIHRHAASDLLDGSFGFKYQRNNTGSCTTAATWYTYISGSSTEFRLYGSGLVVKYEHAGDVRFQSDVYVNGTTLVTSDERLKERVVSSKYDVLSVLGKLRVVDFNWKACMNKKDRRRKRGLIAQEVERVIPRVVYTDAVELVKEEDLVDECTHDGEFDKLRYQRMKAAPNQKSVAYGDLIPDLILAVQELTKRIRVLESKI
jgi:hypothetical protein